MKRFLFLVALVLLVSCSSTKLNCTAPPSDMSAWWTFDANSNATSQDIAGIVDNVGTASGGVVQVPNGMVAGAACLDGANGAIVVQNQAEVDFSGNCANDAAEAFTIDFWIKTGAAAGTRTVLDKRINALNDLRGWSVYLWNGLPGFQMATGPGSPSCNSPLSACTNFTATSSPRVDDGGWHFVAISVQPRCRGAAGFIYVDGAVRLTFIPRVGDISSPSDLYIGRHAPPFPDDFLKGCIDELEIFKRGLTAAELNAIWNAGPNGKCKKK